MKTKLLSILLIGGLLFGNSAKAQNMAGGENPKNVVKLNLFALAFTNFSLQYERVFNEKTSGALGFSVMPSRNLPSSLSSDPILAKTTLSDWSITPEFRWYPGTKKGAPHGFYLAPYLRYSSTSILMPFDFTETSGAITTYKIDANYSGFGGGVMLGAQWLINEKFSIDWWILGGHYGSGSASVAMKADFSALSATDRAKLETDLNGIAIPVGTIKSTISNSEAKIDISSLPYFGVRSGLTIGWAF